MVTRVSASTSLDAARFGTCVAAGRYPQVDADLIEGKKLGVTGTPKFFLGRLLEDGTLKVEQVLRGNQTIEAFTQAIKNLPGL